MRQGLGSQQLRMPALGNLVHIKLAQDRLQETIDALAELKQRKGGGMEIGILGTEMQVALASRGPGRGPIGQ